MKTDLEYFDKNFKELGQIEVLKISLLPYLCCLFLNLKLDLKAHSRAHILGLFFFGFFSFNVLDIFLFPNTQGWGAVDMSKDTCNKDN